MVSIGLFVLRVVVGLTVAGHGAQKLFGWVWRALGSPGLAAGWRKCRSNQRERARWAPPWPSLRGSAGRGRLAHSDRGAGYLREHALGHIPGPLDQGLLEQGRGV